jgi:hypothetical protein
MTALSQTRSIQVYQSATAKSCVIQTASNSWAEVKSQIEALGPDWNLSNLKAVVGSTKGTLELPDATIPEGNQTIILVAKKQDSGAAPAFYKEYSYYELRKLAKANGISGKPVLTKNQIIEKLEEIYNAKSTKGKARKAVVETIKAKASVKKAPADLVKELKSELAASGIVFNNATINVNLALNMKSNDSNSLAKEPDVKKEVLPEGLKTASELAELANSIQ